MLPASSAITLTMEVSFPFHSHLIGRSGQKVNQLMEQRETRIHFPDTNRVVGHPKSNTVVVRGSMVVVKNTCQRNRVKPFSSTQLLLFSHNYTYNFFVENHSNRVCYRVPNGATDIIDQPKLFEHYLRVYGALLRFYSKIDGLRCQVNI